MLNIYTDGACSGNPGPGGWAFIIPQENDDPIVQTGGYVKTTNNMMELQALLEALKYCNQLSPQCVTIYTDSAYIANCFNQKWYIKWQQNGWISSSKEPVKNRGQWEDILYYYNLLTDNDFIINIEKIKGHSNNIYNQMADKYAVSARKEIEKCS